jgi:glycosyltransferase involved in cell wall biosynthesis
VRLRGGGALTSVAFHVDQLWFPAPGGIGTYVRELAPALQRADPSLELEPFRSRFDVEQQLAWTVPMRGGVVLARSIRALYPLWDLAARPSLPPALARCDVVHATNPAAVPPATRDQRLVVTVHDLAFVRFPELFTRRWRWLYRLGLRAAVRRADAILAPSEATASELRERSNVDPARVHVVPLGASPPPHPPADPGPVLERLGVTMPYLLFVGTLEPRKNVARLVRAYRSVAGRGAPHALVLAGWPGWRDDELRAEVARVGPGSVVELGGVGLDELDALYRGADAFVYPSLAEGFGLPVVEAMARGVPTITSNVSSLPEVAGTAALLVDPGSEDELAAGIERVLGEPGLAKRLRREGPVRAARFTWEATAAGTLAVYREVLGR